MKVGTEFSAPPRPAKFSVLVGRGSGRSNLTRGCTMNSSMIIFPSATPRRHRVVDRVDESSSPSLFVPFAAAPPPPSGRGRAAYRHTTPPPLLRIPPSSPTVGRLPPRRRLPPVRNCSAPPVAGAACRCCCYLTGKSAELFLSDPGALTNSSLSSEIQLSHFSEA